MRFTSDTEPALRSAVRLVNTASSTAATDGMATMAQLRAFYEEEGYTGRKPSGAADLEQVRALRPRLRELLTADRDRAANLVNVMLSESDTHPRLVRHDALDWHLHVVPDDSPLAERIKVETAMAMVDLIRADELSRLGVCAADGCDGVVLDLTRNRSKIFCSPTCSNAAAVAAYRARQRAE